MWIEHGLHDRARADLGLVLRDLFIVRPRGFLQAPPRPPRAAKRRPKGPQGEPNEGTEDEEYDSEPQDDCGGGGPDGHGCGRGGHDVVVPGVNTNGEGTWISVVCER